jgi:hypothetical protein
MNFSLDITKAARSPVSSFPPSPKPGDSVYHTDQGEAISTLRFVMRPLEFDRESPADEGARASKST